MDSRGYELAQKVLSLIAAEPELREDAEATLKFAIFDGIVNSFGKSPEQIRDTIYKNITSPELRWALEASRLVQEARCDERRRCANRAIAFLRSLGPDEEWNEERLSAAILQGTAPAKKQVPYSGDPETCECEYHRACRGELPAKELESNG